MDIIIFIHPLDITYGRVLVGHYKLPYIRIQKASEYEISKGIKGPSEYKIQKGAKGDKWSIEYKLQKGIQPLEYKIQKGAKWPLESKVQKGIQPLEYKIQKGSKWNKPFNDKGRQRLLINQVEGILQKSLAWPECTQLKSS